MIDPPSSGGDLLALFLIEEICTMAPFRRSALPRSGRIKADNVAMGAQLTIVSRGSGPFRIYNTDKNAFNVRPGAQSEIRLEHRCSADVDPNGDIIITATVAGDLRGIYESINPHTIIRSGKFKRSGTFTIAQRLGDETFYRIFNTHKQHSFQLHVNDASIVTLRPRLSVDVTALNKVSVVAANEVTGIYDYLDPRNVIQPGRFNVTLGDGESHTIINLAGSTKRALYRLHNSSANPLVVKRGATVVRDGLAEDQSIDFEIRADDADADKIITVAPTTSGVPIQGMYEFLGP
jgi:hypothetical protein